MPPCWVGGGENTDSAELGSLVMVSSLADVWAWSGTCDQGEELAGV